MFIVLCKEIVNRNDCKKKRNIKQIKTSIIKAEHYKIYRLLNN